MSAVALVFRAATGKSTEVEDACWYRDPAASGWRSRMFVGPWELLAYDDGAWSVSRDFSCGVSGHEVDGEAAKQRAVTVYNALSRVL